MTSWSAFQVGDRCELATQPEKILTKRMGRHSANPHYLTGRRLLQLEALVKNWSFSGLVPDDSRPFVAITHANTVNSIPHRLSCRIARTGLSIDSTKVDNDTHAYAYSSHVALKYYCLPGQQRTSFRSTFTNLHYSEIRDNQYATKNRDAIDLSDGNLSTMAGANGTHYLCLTVHFT